MSDQLGASGNLNLWYSCACSTNLYDTLSREIKKTACIAATRSKSVLVQTYYTPYITIILIICTVIRIISKLEIQIWVHIHCRKLANRHIHNWGSVSKQKPRAARTQSSRIKGSWPMACPPSAGTSGYTLRMYAIQPARKADLKLFWFVQPEVIRDTELTPYAPENDILSIIRIIV